MEWAGADTLILQRLNRPQNTDVVMLASAATGETHPILTERDSAWLDVVDTMPFIDHGKSFLWESERDGWRHVYRVSKDGKKVKLITPGDFDVIGVAGVDDKGGWLYYYGMPRGRTGTERGRKGDGGGAARRVPSPHRPLSDLRSVPRAPSKSSGAPASTAAVLASRSRRPTSGALTGTIWRRAPGSPSTRARRSTIRGRPTWCSCRSTRRFARWSPTTRWWPGSRPRSRRRDSSTSPSPTAPRSTAG